MTRQRSFRTSALVCAVVIACGAPSAASESHLASGPSSAGGSWSVTSFFDGPEVFISAAAIARRGERPAVAVLDRNSARLLYASDPLGGSGFEVVPLQLPPMGSTTIDLAIAPDGTPHIFVLRRDDRTYTFGYATRSAGGWTTDPLVSTGPRSIAFLLGGAAVDAAGNAHALVGLLGTMLVFSRTPPGWSVRPIGISTAFAHMTSSPTGSIHVCGNSAEGVVHVFRDQSDVWASEVVYPSLIQTGRCSIAAVSPNDVRVVFDAAPRKMYHARKVGAAWEVTTLPTPFFGSEIPSSRPGWNQAGAEFAVVRAAEFTGTRLYGRAAGVWVDETPGALWYEQTPPLVAPGAEKPYIAVAWNALRIWSYSLGPES